MSHTIDRIIEIMEAGTYGQIELQNQWQKTGKMAWSVRGFGVDASLLQTPEKAFAAWEEAYDAYLIHRGSG